jgi:nucleoside-diphosphate-sugar epimerase
MNEHSFIIIKIEEHAMQVLVTGGFGNVGISTVNALLSAGHRVCIFEHPSAKKRSSKRLRMLQAQYASRFMVFYGDITDAQALASALAEGFCFDRPASSPESELPQAGDRFAVVHLAGVIPPLTDRFIDLAERINVGGTRALISACRTLPESARIVFASSIALYGDRLASPWISVSDPLQPNDPYSLSKQTCEALIM